MPEGQADVTAPTLDVSSLTSALTTGAFSGVISTVLPDRWCGRSCRIPILHRALGYWSFSRYLIAAGSLVKAKPAQEGWACSKP